MSRVTIACHLIMILGGSLVVVCQIPACTSTNHIAYFSGCNLTRMPPVKSDVMKLDLGFNYISEVNRDFFPVLNTLGLLYLHSQKTGKLIIRKDGFKNTPNLLELDVASNRLLILDPEAFSGLSLLRNLFLYDSQLNGSILENDYFKELNSLELVDLSSNDITYLRPHPLFYKLYNLEILDLRHNKISSICAGDLHSFERKYFSLMDLSSNKLFKWEAAGSEGCGNPFQKIQFGHLKLSSNGFSVDLTRQVCRTLNGTQIKQLTLDHHAMGSDFGFHNLKNPDNTTFTGLFNSNLKVLDLSKGRIFSLNPFTFSNLTKLEALSLFENKINIISQNAFYGLDSLQWLNLSYNLLGEIYNHQFDNLINVIDIDLQENHIGPIEGKAFQNLHHLKYLNLRSNAIKSIIFCENINPLGAVLLGINKIRTIDSYILNSSFIDLSENNLNDLGKFYKLLQYPLLQHLLLKQNRFSQCYPFFQISKNNQLIYLDLGENMIQLIWNNGQCLDIFRKLSLLLVLHLNQNFLRDLPGGIFNGLDSLQRLNLSSNLLTHLIPGVFPASLEILDLSNNHLYAPSPAVFMSLNKLDLSNNFFMCGCPLVDFLIWLNHTNTTIMGNPEDLYCLHPNYPINLPLYSLNLDYCDEDIVLEPLMFSLFVLTMTFIFILVAPVIVFTRFRGLCFIMYKRIVNFILGSPKQEEGNKACKYDAYFCYSSKDFPWVQDAFFQNLDSQYSQRNEFRLCFEERDFIPGEDHIVNIRDAIWNSKKTICIVTKNFLKDGWCIQAFNYAQSRYFTEMKDVLIMVIVGSLSHYQLMKYQPIRAYVRRCAYLRWPEDYQDVEWFLSRLSYQIIKEKKVGGKLKAETKNSSNLELQNITTIS
ncbi:hypothetical protein GDO86_009107 [Hymenochirus boettgeri]|uniref:Toll-like receptor 5 n=1 Tax=Hymenochirus boettgeri TaxID=247094 RepID=A0A8T2JJX6_9PIPI|nr:hypothetical protein GDO86_009107 [Hymenochirus boettgeri]